MDKLADQLCALMSPEIKAEIKNSMERNSTIESKSLRHLPPDPMASREGALAVNDLDESNPGTFKAFLQHLQNTKPRFMPRDNLPCANVQVAQYTACENNGKLACSACKLVSYCSKECQKVHWKLHKRDCKNQMGSKDWRPIWIIEKRQPSFIADDGGSGENFCLHDEFSVGCALWGNTPATDVINLDYNEKNANRDFALAFVASGDLRHVVYTINALPSNFTGNLEILVNDATLVVTCRNIVLLLILGTISDEIIAADIALHFWYSAFIPMEYSQQILSALLLFLSSLQHNSRIVFPLGPHSTLRCCLPPQATECLLQLVASTSISINDAQNEYDRVRNAPSRSDLRDRMYVGLRPSHRIAFQQFRRFGIVLPFGAINAHFNHPNLSLFSQNGKWLQTDYADPLEGWNLDEIIQSGKAHNAHPEDIYGCLYFFLSEQLRTFAHRLRTFKISFKVFPFDACHLSEAIRQNSFAEYGIPASIRFDRIVVSNILDVEYVGLRDVLTNWAPLLAENKTAVIVGYFMNWVHQQKDGHSAGASPSIAKDVTKRLVASINIKDNTMRNFADFYSLLSDLDAFYENSKPFLTFLMKQGLKDILCQTKLILREKHTIVPHRDMVHLEASSNALPEFPDNESWYYRSKLSSNTWLSRYVEFSRK